jgi:HEPN domain-containing protein
MRTTDSGFNEEVYLLAAQEHIFSLNRLMDDPKQYVLAYYVSGLAVECLFRAYMTVVGAEHDAKHDLRKLAENARFVESMPEDQQDDVRAALGEVITRWRNNHRYRSESALRQFLKEEGLFKLPGGRSLRGDIVKHNVVTITESATLIVTVGAARWKVLKKKWQRS